MWESFIDKNFSHIPLFPTCVLQALARLCSLIYSHFWPIFLILKNRVGFWDNGVVCVCVHPLPDQLLNAWTNLYETWYVYHGTWVNLNALIKQEVLGRTNRLSSSIRHGPHWKQRVQQFVCCSVCIRYRGNVSTEPFPSNDHKPTLFFLNRKAG
jgi:hypothetical protein